MDTITDIPGRSGVFLLSLILVCSGFSAVAHAVDDFNADSLGIENVRDISVPMPLKPAQAPLSRNAHKARPIISGDADMSEFFRRLESIGLDTRELLAITSKIEVFFRKPSSTAEAEYGYILNNLYLPHSYREKSSKRIRFDLESYNINTIIHEYVHAARDVYASADAPKGTPAREHYDAVHVIQADLRSQSLFYRYSWMKADEVSAYFMGAAIATLFGAVDDIVLYNTRLNGAKSATVAEAERLGGRLIVPSQSAKLNAWERRILTAYARFGRNSVYDEAQFHDNNLTGFVFIHWKERQFVKDDMYNNILGLKPPKTLQELLGRLNTIDNEWIRGVRRQVADARLKNARKAEAETAKQRE